MQTCNVVITGGTDGIGKAVAAELAAQGGQLLLIGRNNEKGEQAVSDLVRSSGNSCITFLQADLSLMCQVRRVAQHIHRTLGWLDILVHSAGGLFPFQRTLTDEGMEISFAIQYLARYALTIELIDLLRAAPAPRVISIAGGGTTSDVIDFGNLNSEKRYGAFAAVARSGVTNDALTLEQAARWPDITFYNYGPGLVRTRTVQNMPAPARLIMNTLGRAISRAPEQAAHDIVALLSDGYPSGLYTVSLKRNNPPAPVADSRVRTQLWDHSHSLVDSLLCEETIVQRKSRSDSRL